MVCAVWVGVKNVALVHSWWNLGASLPTLLSILSPEWANFLIKDSADGYGVPAGVKAGAANSSAKREEKTRLAASLVYQCE